MHSAHMAGIRRWWRSLSTANRLTIVGLIITVLFGVVAVLPSYLDLFDNRGPEESSPAAPSGATSTSLRQLSGQEGALRIDAVYNRTPESIMWATAQSLPPEDDPVIRAPNLAGNDPAQSKIAALLLKRGGVKIESDETENFRPHSQVCGWSSQDSTSARCLSPDSAPTCCGASRPCPRPLSLARHKAQVRTSR